MRTIYKAVVGLALMLFVLMAFGGVASACRYVVGDVNDDGRFDGMDIVFAVKCFSDGILPPYSCECPPGSGNIWYVAGDVNASCSFNGLDVTYMVAYFKGGPLPRPCPECPPEQ
jgi:hypothetical protein